MEKQLKSGTFEKSLYSKTNPKNLTDPKKIAAYAENHEKMQNLIKKNMNAALEKKGVKIRNNVSRTNANRTVNNNANSNGRESSASNRDSIIRTH